MFYLLHSAGTEYSVLSGAALLTDASLFKLCVYDSYVVISTRNRNIAVHTFFKHFEEKGMDTLSGSSWPLMKSLTPLFLTYDTASSDHGLMEGLVAERSRESDAYRACSH
jgi:hypothetical protein